MRTAALLYAAVAERDRLKAQRIPVEHVEAQKRGILQLAEKLQSLSAHLDPPFEVKQRILKMTVNQILMNTREGWFQLDGMVRGSYTIDFAFA